MSKILSVSVGVLLAVAALFSFSLYRAEVKKNLVLKNENTKTYEDMRRELASRRQQMESGKTLIEEGRAKYLKQISDLEEEREDLVKRIKELEGKLADEEEASNSVNEDIDSLRQDLSRVKKERTEIAVKLEQGFEKKKKAYEMKILSLESQLQKSKNRLSSEAERYHYNLGVTAVRVQDYENAVKEFQTALSYNPNNAKAHYNLGIIYDDSFKDKKQARYHYKAFLDLQPQSDEAEAVREWLQATES